MFVAFAALPGYTTPAADADGSLFMLTLAKQLRKYHTERHLVDIYNTVKIKLSKLTFIIIISVIYVILYQYILKNSTG